MTDIYLLLGSNMGDSELQLEEAIKHIEQSIGKVKCRSGLYQTAAWGDANQPDFLNQVIIAETNLSAQQTMQTILSIEKEMGRIRTYRNAPRVIDVDILFFGDAIINDNNLIIPHKEIPNRRFVLVPLNELSPNFIHPVLHKKMQQLLADCRDELNVKKYKLPD